MSHATPPPPHRSSTPHLEYMKPNHPSSSSSSTTTTSNLQSYQPFLISGNIRLAHRYPSPQRVDEWMRNAYIRRTASASSSNPHDPPLLGSEGDLILGDLLPPPHLECRILDAHGLVHIIPASPSPRPIRVLAVLANRDSTVHANGGLVDEEGERVNTIPIVRGMQMWWLGEESGLVGHLIRDTPQYRVIGVSANANANSAASPHHRPLPPTVKFTTPAMPFTLIGLVHDASSHQPMNVRSFRPIIPPPLAASPSSSFLSSPSSLIRRAPRLLLVGATTSTAGKTSLVCSLILALHAQHQQAAAAAQEAQHAQMISSSATAAYGNGSSSSASHHTSSPPPHHHHQPLRISYVKFTGSGSLRDKLDVQSLRLESPPPPPSHSHRSSSSSSSSPPTLLPAITHCYDHVDVGLISTYSTLPGTSERFKAAVNDLMALASAPVPVAGQTQNGGEELVPIDYIVGELGSDLIWSHNPLLLSMSSIQSSLLGLYLITSDALSLLGACNYLHGTLHFPPERLVLVNSHQYTYAGLVARIRGSEVALVEHTMEHIEQTLKALVMGKEEEEELIRMQHRKAEKQIMAEAMQMTKGTTSAASSSSTSNGHSSSHNSNPPRVSSSHGSSSHPPPPDGTPNAFYHHSTSTNVTTAYSDASSGGANQTIAAAAPSPANGAASSNGNGNGSSASSDHQVHYDLTIPLYRLAHPTSSFTDLTSEVCHALMQWSAEEWLIVQTEGGVIRSLPSLSSLLASLLASTDDMTLRSELSSILISLTRDARLQQAMNYQHLVKKRDHAKAKPITSSQANSRATLGDYQASPYYLTPAILPLPSSLASSLLAYDSGLACLRLKFVPSRVSEECFWLTYTAALNERMSGFTQQKMEMMTTTVKKK